MEQKNNSRFRSLSGYQLTIWNLFLFLIPATGIAYILSLYNLFNIMIYREQYFGVFLALVLVSVFLGVPATKSGKYSTKIPWYDAILALASLTVGMYVAIFYPEILVSFGIISTERLVLSVLAIALILESLRRLFGWVLTGIVMFVIAYGFTTPYFPGALKGQATAPDQLVNYLFLDANSLLYMLNIASTMALAFIFLGQVLIHFKGGDMFNDIAISLFGKFRGGPAKISVIGSSFVGSITGGPVSNVLLTGNMTIPLMKRTGYSKAEAGAIESVGSTGGIILPPVMGIAAFLIAENLGVSYTAVAVAAIVPAILYYLCLFVQVDLKAGRKGMSSLPKEAIPKFSTVLKKGWILVPVFVFLIVLLFVWNYPPATSGIYTALIGALIFLTQKQGRHKFLTKLKNIFMETGKTTLEIGVVLSAAGLIVGVVGVTGLGFNLVQSLTQVGDYGLIFLLIASAVISVVLGMGMPAVAAYSMVAVLITPSLIELGVPALAAHMFVFYYSILSSFTPPIAVACFAASSIAGENPNKIAFESVKLGAMAYIVPFLFVYSPSLLLGSGEGTLFNTIASISTVTFGCIILAVGVVGYLFNNLNALKRSTFIIISILLFVPIMEVASIIFVINIIGIVLGVLFISKEFKDSRTNKAYVEAEQVSS